MDAECGLAHFPIGAETVYRDSLPALVGKRALSQSHEAFIFLCRILSVGFNFAFAWTRICEVLRLIADVASAFA